MKRSKVRRYYRRMNLRHLRRWWRERCTGCGHRLWFNEAGYSLNGKPYHGNCEALVHLRHVAEDRLLVLDVVTDVWAVDADTAREVVAGRAETDGYERSNAWNAAWRVFRSIEQRREAAVKRQDSTDA